MSLGGAIEKPCGNTTLFVAASSGCALECALDEAWVAGRVIEAPMAPKSSRRVDFIFFLGWVHISSALVMPTDDHANQRFISAEVCLYFFVCAVG